MRNIRKLRRSGIFVEPKLNPSPGLRPPSPIRWARDTAPSGRHIRSLRTATMPLLRSLVCSVFSFYKYASPDGLVAVMVSGALLRNVSRGHGDAHGQAPLAGLAVAHAVDGAASHWFFMVEFFTARRLTPYHWARPGRRR